ncbi:MAG TPA: TfuA-like protein [Solirubrobacteraceae bacterium]
MIHVFVGPTLSAETVVEHLPDANVCPPVKHGDVLRLDPRPGDVVAIVDGLFHEDLPIRHKEILDLLDRGVHVCGASCMGALRAAELHPYGMVGIGRIFEMLVHGDIEGDDEASLAHRGASDGYQPLSEALVDIRFHCRQALEAGVSDEEDAAAIVAAASALAYDERAYARVLADAATHGLSPSAASAFVTFTEREGARATRDDALALLRHLRALPPAATTGEAFELAETHALRIWRDSRRGARDPDGGFVSDRILLNFIRIAARDYPAFHERVALEELAALYGEHLGHDVPAVAELTEEFRGDAGLRPDQAWAGWCAEHRIREEELQASLVRRALLRAVTGASGEIAVELLRQVANDYAVTLGLWPDGEPPEAKLAQWLAAQETRRMSSVEQVARVAVRTFRLHPNTPPDGLFVTELKLSGAYAVAHAALVERPPLPKARPRADAVLDWCAMRWGVHAISPLDVLDRGLGSTTSHAQDQSLIGPLAKRAGRYYARVEASGDYPLITVAPGAGPLLGATTD